MNARERAEYARRLRAAFEKDPITGVALAERSGVPLRTVQDFMAGATTPQEKTLHKIARVLNVEVDAEAEWASWPDDVKTFANIVGLYLSRFPSPDERRARMDALTRTMVSGQ